MICCEKETRKENERVNRVGCVCLCVCVCFFFPVMATASAISSSTFAGQPLIKSHSELFSRKVGILGTQVIFFWVQSTENKVGGASLGAAKGLDSCLIRICISECLFAVVFSVPIFVSCSRKNATERFHLPL